MIDRWAIRHGVSSAALAELKELLGALTESAHGTTVGFLENPVQNDIKLEASQKGARLWRNNVGGCYTAEGGFLRYGLCNESKRMNSLIKSSDLIGIKPLLITEAYVGTVIGQFVAREVKRPGWKYSNSPRERAQLKFLMLVATMGGDARFASAVGTL